MACIFCSIAHQEIPAERLYETDDVFVIKDLHPKAKVHVLVIPKAHLVTFNEVTASNVGVIAAMGLAVAAVVKQQGIADSGYKVVANNGQDGGQEVPHMHWHVLGGQSLKGLV